MHVPYWSQGMAAEGIYVITENIYLFNKKTLTLDKNILRPMCWCIFKLNLNVVLVIFYAAILSSLQWKKYMHLIILQIDLAKHVDYQHKSMQHLHNNKL